MFHCRGMSIKSKLDIFPTTPAILKMRERCSFETSGTDYPVTRRRIAQEGSPQPQGRENLRTRVFCL